jgi:methionyl-tRNA formyltransferase
MKILVFVSKWVGLKCLDVLLTDLFDDKYEFVVMEPDAKLIIEKLNQHDYKYKILNDETINWIQSREDEYFDWLLNLWGGYIFKEDMLKKVKNSLNIHPSYLPYGRGTDPIVWSIRYGFPAGVTLHKITSDVDEGPILYQEEIKYELPITGGELYERVIDRCWKGFSEQWINIRSRSGKEIEQNNKSIIRTFRREDLIQDNIINLDEDSASRDLVTRFLAHDFGEKYSIKIILNNKKYAVRLEFKELNELGEQNV